jgi:flagellar motor switch protein FliN
MAELTSDMASQVEGDPLTHLPVYARSLLKIKVPVQVRLASKRQSIGEIVDLCPGSIITFTKTCDEMLELKAGGCGIAVGEAVKVGDKFGLRISEMTLPNERFEPVRPTG